MSPDSGTTVKVYSVFKNCQDIIVNKKNTDLDKIWPTNLYNKLPDYIQKNYHRIYNDIENGYYTYFDLILAIYHKYLFTEKVFVNKIKYKYIKDTKNLYTKSELQKSKKILLDINSEFGFKNIQKYFNIQEDGYALIYNLIKKEIVSPILFLKYFNFTENNKNVNKEYKRFIYIMKKIKNIINMTKKQENNKKQGGFTYEKDR